MLVSPPQVLRPLMTPANLRVMPNENGERRLLRISIPSSPG